MTSQETRLSLGTFRETPSRLTYTTLPPTSSFWSQASTVLTDIQQSIACYRSISVSTDIIFLELGINCSYRHTTEYSLLPLHISPDGHHLLDRDPPVTCANIRWLPSVSDTWTAISSEGKHRNTSTLFLLITLHQLRWHAVKNIPASAWQCCPPSTPISFLNKDPLTFKETPSRLTYTTLPPTSSSGRRPSCDLCKHQVITQCKWHLNCRLFWKKATPVPKCGPKCLSLCGCRSLSFFP